MMVEIVFFDLPPGTTRDAALALYRKSAGKWLANPDLIEKYYFFDEPRRLGGGVYVWKTQAAVERWHGDDYRRMIGALYGSKPRNQILDALIRVDPAAGTLAEL